MTIFARSPCWLFVLLLAGCGPGRAEPPIADDTFIEVMVALRRAAVEHSGDAPAFDAARDRILADAGITDSLLYAYVDAHADEPAGLGGVFDEVRDRLREPADEPEREGDPDDAPAARRDEGPAARPGTDPDAGADPDSTEPATPPVESADDAVPR